MFVAYGSGSKGKRNLVSAFKMIMLTPAIVKPIIGEVTGKARKKGSSKGKNTCHREPKSPHNQDSLKRIEAV